MNCPQCSTEMIKAQATNFGPTYDYCRTCRKELAEMQGPATPTYEREYLFSPGIPGTPLTGDCAREPGCAFCGTLDGDIHMRGCPAGVALIRSGGFVFMRGNSLPCTVGHKGTRQHNFGRRDPQRSERCNCDSHTWVPT